MQKLKFENLDMLSMYKDGIKRGKDDTFAIYVRKDGKREKYSYNYIQSEANKLSAKLKEAGLRKGDRIGVISSLRPWWFALSLVCLQDGYIMVCIDPGVPVNQVQVMLVQSQTRAIFTTLNKVHLPDELEGHIPVYSIEQDFPLIDGKDKVDRVLLGEPIKLPSDTFYILFSSGTTSENRKAVLLKNSTVTTAIEYCMAKDTGVYRNKTPYTVSIRDLMLFPPYHIAGLLCATYDIYCNTQIIMLERLTPNGLTQVFSELKPDNICTVPSMITSIYKKIYTGYTKKPLTKYTVNLLLGISSILRRTIGIKAGRVLLKPINRQAFGGRMKSFMIGASPIDAVSNKFFLDMGIDVVMAYGLTELGAPVATTGQGYYPGTAGRIPRHKKDIDIRIVNSDDTGRGEVEVLSPYRMISYLFKKDNIGCFTEDGYFKTGDLGYFDSKKCLNICGRIKESIVLKNGEKLLPEEIESKYQNMDSVKEIVAFKVPGSGGCDDFAIALVKDKDIGIPDEAMKTRVYERAELLPQMYRPKDVYVVKEFPLSSSHKVQRFRLTEMVINGENEPVTDALMVPVDEDETTSKLRKILIEIGGVEWKAKKLFQGLLLNLDSLSMVDLYVAIQNEWDIDLFQTTIHPETFGELLDVIKNYEVEDKKTKAAIDLSEYPKPISKLGRFAIIRAEKLMKQMWHVKAEGLENLPKDTNYLLCSNHRTDFDPGFISCILPREVDDNTCIVGKADIIDYKFIRILALNHNLIPIDRTGNSIKTLDRCRELLNEGRNILIFPEGTSVQRNTKLYPLKDGAAKLAIATGRPIVPLHITGIAVSNKETGAFDVPSTKSHVVIKFGKPFYPNNMSVEELNELMSQKIQELD